MVCYDVTCNIARPYFEVEVVEKWQSNKDGFSSLTLLYAIWRK